MRKRVILLSIGIGVVLLAGCTQRLHQGIPARIDPERGHVPYQATITADPAAKRYTFQLPHKTIEQTSNTLEVTVDSLTWLATVTCDYGGSLRTFEVTATGTNALPRINPPVINGDLERWFLRPFEQTLISFEPRVGRGIAYGGECRVTSIEVRGDDMDYPFSMFYPPYEPGTCHAVFRGWLHENAGIVYPCYTSIGSPEGLPYSPTNLEEGYPYIGWKNTNVYSWGGPTDEGQEILPQQGTITVVVEDNFGRSVSASFSIPIEGLDFQPQPTGL